MGANPILDEIRAAREKLLADADGDLEQLVAQMQARQAKSGRKVIKGRVGDGKKPMAFDPVPENTASSEQR